MTKPKLIGCVGHDCADCKKQKRDMRNQRTHLKALTDHVLRHLVWLDEEMRKPESPERGKRMAALANVLEIANDSARYHGLGIDFRKDNKDKERVRRGYLIGCDCASNSVFCIEPLVVP